MTEAGIKRTLTAAYRLEMRATGYPFHSPSPKGLGFAWKITLARCNREIAEASKQMDAPAWLVTLGIEDWNAEKRLIGKSEKLRIGVSTSDRCPQSLERYPEIHHAQER